MGRWVIAGGLLGVGFVWPMLWMLGVVGIAYVIHLTLREQSYKRLLVGSVVAWTIKSALALVWFWSVYPIEWLAIGLGGLQLLLISVWWLTAALWLGLGGIVFGGGVKLAQQYLSTAGLFLTIPFIWILAELSGSIVFSIITIGAGGTITTAFSFGYVGYLATQHELLIQVARISGVYSLGFLIVLLAAAAVWVWQYKTGYKPFVYMLVTVFILTSFVSTRNNIEPIAGASYTVAIIDTAFPLLELRSADGRKAAREKLEEAMQTALALQTDYILLPEDARYFSQHQDAALVGAQFAFRSNNQNVVIVDSGRAGADEKVVLQSFVYNGVNQLIDQSQKRYLVPQGEFMPALYAGALRLAGQGAVVEQVTQSLAYEVGSDLNQADYATGSPGVLFCFESVKPWGVRQIMQERGDVPFVAHPVSHAWFHQPQTLWHQLDSMLRVQAIWNQQYIVSAGNHVRGYAVTPAGTIVYPQSVASGDNWHVGVLTVPKVDR